MTLLLEVVNNLGFGVASDTCFLSRFSTLFHRRRWRNVQGTRSPPSCLSDPPPPPSPLSPFLFLFSLAISRQSYCTGKHTWGSTSLTAVLAMFCRSHTCSPYFSASSCSRIIEVTSELKVRHPERKEGHRPTPKIRISRHSGGRVRAGGWGGMGERWGGEGRSENGEVGPVNAHNVLTTDESMPPEIPTTKDFKSNSTDLQ